MSKEPEVPVNLEAERAILGGILLDNERFYEDADELSADDFSLSSHQTIFRVMNDILFGEAEGVSTVDIVTVANELRRKKELSGVGGVTYLASLTEGLPRRPSVKEYVNIIQAKAKLRKLAVAGRSLYLNALSADADVGTLLGQIHRDVTEVEAEEKGGPVHVGNVTASIRESILEMRNASFSQAALQMTWGLDVLDAKTKGAFGGELTVVAGESGGGKTQLVIQMAIENAMKGVPVGIFSMEMSKEQFVKRMYPLMSSIITASLMRDPRGMTLHLHVPELDEIEKKISGLPIYIDDTSPLTFRMLVARMKKMIREHDAKLFIADYLQLITAPGEKDLQLIQTVMFGSRDFVKKKENKGRHLVLLSQYAKEQGTRKKRRTMGDLHGGAVIHQAAQNVLLITVEAENKKEPGSNLDVEIAIEKQREGPKGRVVCQRDSDSLRYIPAPERPEKKPDEQPRKRNTDAKQRATGGSRTTESES